MGGDTEGDQALGATVLADDETLVQTAGGSIEDEGPRVDVERGTTVGRYTILDRIGSGAMGVVYTAYDPKLDRRIALKLLKIPQVDGALVIARVLREAQALAKLAHPNVVTVHDADSIDDMVFVAMELVDGSNLGKWLRQRPRTPPEILQIFIQAGRGLAAAHAAGLVHRDFKPDNVLVGHDGRVRVVDFGIARNADEDPLAGPSTVGRVLDRDPFESGADVHPRLTQTGAVVGTPAYMSPEQHLGTRVDGRCDQFAFCVALYEALYGAPPFPAKSYVELRHAVLSGRLQPPPSTADVPPHVRAAILRGLSVIPERRFATMTDLLARLEDDPARRRRRALGSAGVGALLAGLVALTVHRIAAAPPPCEGAARHLRGVWDAPVKESIERAFLATGQPYAGKAWESSSRTLDAYASAWVSMRTAACEATEIHHEQSAEAMDLRMSCLDRQLRRLAATTKIFQEADADTVLHAVEAASGLPALDECADAEALRRGEPIATGAQKETLDRFEDVLARANALEAAARYRESQATAEQALTLAREIGSRRAEARALKVEANAADQLGQSRVAVERLGAAAQLAEEAGADDLRGEIWSYLGFVIALGLDRADEGERLLRHTDAILERVDATRIERARNRSRLAAVLMAAGRYDEALPLARQATDDIHAIQGEESIYLMAALNVLGNLHDLRGESDEALANLRRALAIAEQVLGGEHPETAKILNNIAIVHKSRGAFADALADYQRALAIRQRVYGGDDPQCADLLTNLGNLMSSAGRYDEALGYQRDALAIFRRQSPPDPQRIGRLLYNIGVIHHIRGEYERAIEEYEEALPLTESVFGPDHPEAAFPLAALGAALVEVGRLDEARALLERALAIRTRKDVPPVDLGEIRFALARALPADESARALELAREARRDYADLGDTETVARIDAWLAAGR